MNRKRPVPNTTRRAALVLSALTLATAGVTAHAATQCYTFDSFEDKTEFTAGDSKQLKNAEITFYQYYDENLQQVNKESKATVDTSNILKSPPSLVLNHRILVKIKPDQPIRRVTLNYAQNTGSQNNAILNLGVNGKLIAWRGNLMDKDSSKLGKDAFGGLVQVSVTEQPIGSGDWIGGTFELVSDPAYPNRPDRGISRFGLGASSQLVLDDICLETF
jgi:hypothetical protein